MSEEDYSRGAKEERDRITAWLMETAYHHHKGGSWIPKRSLRASIARAVERCDHWHPVPAGTKPKGPLRVVRAALCRPGGTPFTCEKLSTHAQIKRRLERKGFCAEGYVSGYLLSNGKFASPEMAAKVAVDAGQVRSLLAPPLLLVEDMANAQEAP